MRKFAALVVALIALAIPSFAGNDALKTPAPSPSWAQVYPAPPNVGLLAARPTFCALTGQTYYATDNTTLYYSTVAGTSCTWTAVGGSGSTGAWSALTAGANTNTGLFSMAQAGIFTVAAQNETTTFNLTGGSSCNIRTAIAPNGGGGIGTDALAACVNVPSGASVTNGFSVAVAGYAVNNNSSSLGQFGKASGIGMYGAAACVVNNSKCEGAVFQAADLTGSTGTQLIGIEMDVGSNDTSATGFGFFTQYQGGGQPTGDNFPAVFIQSPSSTGTFTSGFGCATGAIASTTFNCLTIGARTSAAHQNSQLITFNANSSAGAGAAITATFSFNQDNFLSLGAPGVAIISPSTVEGYGISLTATAAQPANTLVKIDTAHADAFVICTTADTSCDGFVQATNNANGLCTVGSTFCTVVTTSGSKVKGIIGTGTCAIGNFVIVDTTTNGDIQCTGSVPTITKIIGKALSACASTCAGTTIDVLTKFE